METIIIILLLILMAEVTYLLIRSRTRMGNKRAREAMFIDTSVLIDGRIVAVAQSGFISDTLMIPRSVIGELQLLADNGGGEKRTRARHGLDVVAELQAMESVSVEIFRDSSRAEEGVDERLLKLAKQYNGALCTIDYNLNKVAQVEGIRVVNVNDLAKSLRMAYLPGEKLTLTLTTKGNDNSQAVGHLEDGTMVVVEQAKGKIGSVVEAEVIRSLQTAAGRMMFAKLTTDSSSSRNKKQATNNKQPAKEKQETPQPAATATTNQRSKGRKPTSSDATKKKKRPSNNEDRLIELVNNQG